MKFPRPRLRKRIFIVPTRYGFLYATLVLLLFIQAMDSKNPAFLTVIAILVTFGMLSMVLTHSNLENLEILKLEALSGFSGEQSEFRIHSKCSDATPHFSIEILESLKDFKPGATQMTPIHFSLQKRGRIKRDSLKISTLYPLGLFYAWTYIEQPFEYFVYPRKIRITVLKEMLRQWRQDPAHALKSKQNPVPYSRSSASADDFVGHQSVPKGQEALHSKRRIDWRVFARTGLFELKFFSQSAEPTLLLEWESCPGAGAEEKLSFLSTAIDELHRRQIPFTLQLPGVNLFKPENKNAVSKAAYTHQCLRALAEFNHPNSSNENLQTMA